MKPIRIAQIGMNQHIHAPQIFDTIKTNPEYFDVVGYALVEDERERCTNRMKCFAGYPELTLEEILNDPTIEAVTVETDEIHLTKYAQMAIDAGKHVFMDKPGSQSLPEFERLIESVKKSGKAFSIGYMYRFHPLISRAIERVKKGELGRIFSTEAHMSRLERVEKQKWLAGFRGGMMYYLGCHLIDLVLQIQGLPTSVIPCHSVTGLNGASSEDMCCTVLQYPQGSSIIRVSAVEVGGFERRQLVICGSERTIEISPLEAIAPGMLRVDSKQIERSVAEDGRTTVEKRLACEPFQRYEEMMRAFARNVRKETENPYTPDYELQLFKLILQCCGM